jgi:hypothetical protein
MRKDEAEVLRSFAAAPNVVEAWPLYDSIVICPTLYGNEFQAGWFTSLAAFGAQETHSFWKQRTEGLVGLPYTNQQSADSMDFAFVAHSVGLAIFTPTPNIEGIAEPADGNAGALDLPDALISHWFAADLPRHMAVQLKVQQDIRVELTALQAAPGYGVCGGGAAFPGIAAADHGDIPYISTTVSQGVPILSNRFPLPHKIGIPRTATIEGILHLSEYARHVLTGVLGPQNYQMNTIDGVKPYTYFPKRYIIQMSLFGERMVQQRGQYHR